MTATSSEPVAFSVAASDAADRLGRQIEERRKPLDPLLQQLAAMHEDQRIDAALGNQPGGDHRLAEGGRGRQDARLMPQHLPGGGGLLRPQFALKLHVQGDARASLVAHDGLDMQVRKQLLHFFQAAAGQAEVTGVVFRTADDPRLVVGGKPHRLGLVELGILEGGQPQQPIAEARRQAVLGDVNLVAQGQFQALGQRPGDRRLLPAARGRQGPRLGIFLVRQGPAHADDASAPFGVADDLLDGGAADPGRPARGMPMDPHEGSPARPERRCCPVPAVPFAAAGRSGCRTRRGAACPGWERSGHRNPGRCPAGVPWSR